MGAEVAAGGERRWGTWEELLLGGAVLRHGTRNWDLVSAELRTRSVCPISFTPEVCKAKYEDLQQKFSGCKTLFEELRKQRMAKLKQALEKSEDSIGSLESKLEVLKSQISNHSNNGCDSSQTGSAAPCLKSDGGVEILKDGSSAGSFTQENRANWSPEWRVPGSTLVEEIETKPDILLHPKQENGSSFGFLAEAFSVRRRRGKRKRKDCGKIAKEGSIGESEVWGSPDVFSGTLCKENSGTSSGQTGKCSGVDGKSKSLNDDEVPEIVRLFDLIAENKSAMVFRRRLDSQKRGRYKKMIMQHMDLDTLRSRISSHTITSLKEMFRDLLLIANNALVFYSKTTREYKSAFQLREMVTESLRENLKDYYTNTKILIPKPMPNSDAKARGDGPGDQKVDVKGSKLVKNVVKSPNVAKKSSNVCSPVPAESLTVTKKASGRPRKTGQRPENGVKGRKRRRVK